MYPPAQTITAEVYARLPPRLARTDDAAEWTAVNLHGRQVSSFLEGPSFDRAGNLYLVDIPFGRLLRVDPAGEWTVACEYDGWPNGTAIHQDGSVYIADQKHGIMRFDPGRGTVSPVLTHDHLEGFRGCNDLVFGSSGDLFFTDQGQTGLQDPTGRVFRHRADGRLEKIVDFAPSPNGLALSPDEKTLWLCVTRANAVWRVPLLGDGRIGKVGTYVQLSGGMGPDGMAVATDGSIAVAHVAASQVWVFGPVGEPLYRILSESGGLFLTNLAFGGPQGRHLFIVDADNAAILRIELPLTGHPLWSHS